MSQSGYLGDADGLQKFNTSFNRLFSRCSYYVEFIVGINLKARTSNPKAPNDQYYGLGFCIT